MIRLVKETTVIPVEAESEIHEGIQIFDGISLVNILEVRKRLGLV
jgi:hypothetical protein